MSETIEKKQTDAAVKLQILKRDGQSKVPFCQDKIRNALQKAFLSTIAQGSMLSQGMLASIERITQEVTDILLQSKNTVSAEDIQDLLENLKFNSYIT